jgi:hypothetical protein
VLLDLIFLSREQMGRGPVRFTSSKVAASSSADFSREAGLLASSHFHLLPLVRSCKRELLPPICLCFAAAGLTFFVPSRGCSLATDSSFDLSVSASVFIGVRTVSFCGGLVASSAAGFVLESSEDLVFLMLDVFL